MRSKSSRRVLRVEGLEARLPMTANGGGGEDAPPAFQAILPLYQYPLSAPSVLSPWWQEVLDAANPETPLTVVVNPSSGPIDDTHPDYDNWIEALSQLSENPHIQFLAYVSTRISPTSAVVRPTEDILADVSTYAEFFRFPNTSQSFLDGIFLDEMSNLVGNVAAYQTVADAIRARQDLTGTFIAGNPGTSIPIEYLDQTTADLFIVREGTPADLLNNPMPGYVTSSDYSHLDFGAIIHGAADTTTLAEMLKEVKLRALDYVFITDDVLPNPFDVAPSYFDTFLRDLHAPYIATTSYSVYEQSVGVSLGTPVSGDPDVGQTLSYSILSGNEDENFVINAATGEISVSSSATLDIETQTLFELLVQVIDNDTPPLSDTAIISIHVLEDTQDTDIVLSNDTVLENALPLQNPLTVGNLTAVDPTGTQPHSFALYNGVGPNDNVFFTIDGDQLVLQVGTTIDYETKPVYVLHVQATDSQGKTWGQDLLVHVGNRGELELITVGDGSEQRSMVRGLTVIFDTEVTIEPDAFSVNQRGAVGGPVDVSFTTIIDGQGRTIAALAFSGDRTAFGSLVDGNYELHLDGSKITDTYGNLDLDDDGTDGGTRLFGNQAADGFFRLFGDSDGDRTDGFVDFVAFRNAFGSTSGAPTFDDRFDVDGDDVLGFQDFVAFRNRFGSTLGFE